MINYGIGTQSFKPIMGSAALYGDGHGSLEEFKADVREICAELEKKYDKTEAMNFLVHLLAVYKNKTFDEVLLELKNKREQRCRLAQYIRRLRQHVRWVRTLPGRLVADDYVRTELECCKRNMRLR